MIAVGRREALRGLGGLAGLAAGALCAALRPALARARPVPVGRYVALPYGVSSAHVHPTEGGGPRRAGLQRGRAPRRAPRLLFRRRERMSRPRGPTVADDGGLFVGSREGLFAFDPQGRSLFFARIRNVSAAPSLTPSGDLAVVTRHGDLFLVDRAGRIVRERALGIPSLSAPLALPDGSLALTTYDRRLHRVDADLSPLFTFEAREGLPTGVARSRAGRFAFASGGALYRVDLRGRLVQAIELGGRAICTPVVGLDGSLWVVTDGGELVGIEEGGEGEGGARVRARRRLHRQLREGLRPAIGRDGRIRVAAAEEGLVCVSPDGQERWRTRGQGTFLGPVSVDEVGVTLAIDRLGHLSAISPAGVRLWTVELGASSHEAPVLTPEGVIYVTTEAGTLQAWR